VERVTTVTMRVDEIKEAIAKYVSEKTGYSVDQIDISASRLSESDITCTIKCNKKEFNPPAEETADAAQ